MSQQLLYIVSMITRSNRERVLLREKPVGFGGAVASEPRPLDKTNPVGPRTIPRATG
jgi:hypothetical protein